LTEVKEDISGVIFDIKRFANYAAGGATILRAIKFYQKNLMDAIYGITLIIHFLHNMMKLDEKLPF
jgi:hypothetical protein